ncbi:methylenetetrahydrofolate reductase-domain-containing protein [Blastocladiella britannica]|nr:methylenetetrahydrofolate reductase-domain-containing protein [Blastocladiella britannica]
MVKVIDKLRKAEQEGKTLWSFEFFPPKTPAGVQNLYDRLDRMYSFGPSFIDVTWGAGGTTSNTTLDICNVAQSVIGLEVMCHLTCTNMPLSMIDDALATLRSIGIQNVLALRGDPPRGQDRWTACEGGLAYGADLVRYIRKTHGDYFCIAVAGYPEGHLENPDKKADLQFLKDKVDAGADLIVTQMFYDSEGFIEWVKDCRAIGITCPIVPGIMPIQSYAGFNRMTTMSKTKVPDYILEALEPIKDDDAKVKAYGIELAADMCKKLQASGLSAFHLYTLNLEKSVRLILERLEWVPPVEAARPLPWNPSLASKRATETVRPIHWCHRPHSYVARTDNWDDYPNGRWGDARSPAYGELDGYGVSLKVSSADAVALWGTPASSAALRRVFAGYCTGTVKALPWSDRPLAGESAAIRAELAAANARGLLTINSQPPVNGAPSSDPVVGWGPRGGRVYQKAYLEGFVSPATLAAIEHDLAANDPDGMISYHAIEQSGLDLHTNDAAARAAFSSRADRGGDVSACAPNAVTWGVFPGKEVVQPTVVDLASFLAWKDEAFALWDQWVGAVATAPGDEQAHASSAAFLKSTASNSYLITLVHNDFHAPAAALFDVIRRAAVAAERIPESASADEAFAILETSTVDKASSSRIILERGDEGVAVDNLVLA